MPKTETKAANKSQFLTVTWWCRTQPNLLINFHGFATAVLNLTRSLSWVASMACWDETASERSTRYRSFGCAPAPISLIIFSGSLFFLVGFSFWGKKKKKKREKWGGGRNVWSESFFCCCGCYFSRSNPSFASGRRKAKVKKVMMVVGLRVKNERKK